MREIIQTGKVVAICCGRERREAKEVTDEGYIKTDYGLEGDVHAGKGERQISLLASEESKELMEKYNLEYGDFEQNIVTEGIEADHLSLGDRLKVGEDIILEVTQIGKEFQDGYEIFHRVMCERGIFTKVLRGGEIKARDQIQVSSS
ncbi:MOSC domain-containing protein [Acetohalobium arabaticum]|uniref:MOSC domain containing protein n=1 Tax=Acetohalobium arabaticum (strain ATCC 49924 / DSM 5501 / Z-7288) TaxID=574087 RepID=D9QSK6_ACEAZ|nr:MOSC domain-containing protein [Acetohalobium arabaticum]ADL13469.1 MOSC domain containing protein [Acetohalobium arabaticum DSM 5501]